MRTARKLELCLMMLAALTFLGGCNRAQAPLTPVSGRVAYQGSPLPGGTIVFTPDSARGESGPIAFGRINQDGTYHLYTGDALGAVAGKFRVTVTSLAPSGVQIPGQPISPPYSLLPDKYRDPNLSELACEIMPNRTNSIDFNLQ
jgi:hypothetical protein